MVRELIDKTPRVLKALPDGGVGWTLHYAFFARTGFTAAARAEAQAAGGQLVDLQRVDADLRAVDPI